VEINKNHVLLFITKQNISTSGVTKNNWLEILCPNPAHNDRNYGNASINLKSGVIHCFACSFSMSILTYLKTYNNMTYKEACQFLNEGYGFIPSTLNKSVVVTPEVEKIKSVGYDFVFTPLIPSKFLYTSSRGFTQGFCDKFNIVHCISGYTSDYFITPIIDSKKNIFLYEARRLCDYEYLCKFFDSKEPHRVLKRNLEIYIKENEIRYDRKTYQLYKGKKKLFSSTLHYLVQQKVLYPKDTIINGTLWNIDNLNRDDYLYVVEGFGSVPKIYLNISKNVTCTFGSKITESQLEYLNQFKGIILIPDNDTAGREEVALLHTNLKTNLRVIDIGSVEDTDDGYVDVIKEIEPIPSATFLFRKELLRDTPLSIS
jgi:hypothetical protein